MPRMSGMQRRMQDTTRFRKKKNFDIPNAECSVIAKLSNTISNIHKYYSEGT